MCVYAICDLKLYVSYVELEILGLGKAIPKGGSGRNVYITLECGS
jgi:hypothetical protein